jgi:glycosyltransferase involved in cell wall biosynthesis/LmbE family N-acetylglucosaminyl deacetylase
MEEKLVPYESVSKITGRRALVLAPHPDDEVFGCGGAIMRHTEANDALQVIIVSNGEYRVDIEQQVAYGKTRQKESRIAAKVLGYEMPLFWEIADRSVEYGELLIGRITQAIEAHGADLVYAPSVHEMHPDHRALGMAALEAVRRHSTKPLLALYEIGIPMPRINTLLDISNIADRKQSAMACFESQLKEQAYDQHISALNRFRTYTLGKTIQAAEGYFVVPASALERDFLGIYTSEYERQRNIGLALVPSDTPLVSVLIRRMGEVPRRDALNSVALQTYPHIEVIAVDVQSEVRPDLGGWCGRFPATLIEPGKALTLSEAANRALDHARGDFLLFIDDDSWIAPDHISNLVAAMNANSRRRVAYSGAELRGKESQQLDAVTLNEPFDLARLRSANYIPVHAVMFAKNMVTDGARFDEHLSDSADWDFLLQLSRRTTFIHIDHIGAFCRTDETSALNAVADTEKTRRARVQILDKWKSVWTGSELDELMSANVRVQGRTLHQQIEALRHSTQQSCEKLEVENSELRMRAAETASLKQQVADQKATINDLQGNLMDKEHAVRASNALVQEVFSSTSWAVARPIRWLGHQLLAFKQLLRNRPTVRGLVPGLAPNAANSFIVQQQNGKFALSRVDEGYTYIEPQRPANIAEQLADLGIDTSFSIVVPVYNTPVALLDAVIRSVKEQWYGNWQLILIDDASTSKETYAALQRLDSPQIKLISLDNNQGIAGATNVGMAAADGNFVVFMDHDDELTPDCLFELALCIAHNQPDFVFSDEDKLDANGKFTQPHFKPDWSPDTMMSTMFTGHVSCVRRALLDTVGGLRSEFNGCQDWDLVLRISEHTKRISHVPKVLYHWRIIPESVASDIAAKPYVLDASRRVRMEALTRRGHNGTVEPIAQVPGYFRVNYHLYGAPRVSIIIPTRDGGNVLRCCIDSILVKTSYENFEIIILDNGSAESATLDYLQLIQGKNNIRVIRHDKPFNFSELNNVGASHASGDILLFLNDDTEVVGSDWLQRMGGYAQLTHVGAVGAKLVYPNSARIQHAGVINLATGPAHAFLRADAEAPGYFMRNLLEYNWLAVTGACMMIETKKFQRLGGFDVNFPVAYNDIELCIRAVDQGLFNVVCQAVTLIHHESVTRGLDHVDLVKASRLQGELRRLFNSHPAYFQHDPFHNPNLAPNGQNFELSM